MKNERAMSESIGVVLMIGLVVVFVAVIAAIFLGIIDMTPKSAFIAPDIENQTLYGKNIIRITNRGGDTAYLDTGGSHQYEMTVFVDTVLGSDTAMPVSGVEAFGPGTSLFVYQNSTGDYLITNTSTDINSNDARPVPISQISIRLIDTRSQVLIAKWSSGNTAPQAITVTSITPASSWAGSTVTISSLDGTGFGSSSIPKLTRTGSPDIAASGITVISTTKITCQFIIPAGAAPGTWNVAVTDTADSRSGILANGFTVNPALPAPTVTSLNTTTGNRGWPVTKIITGTNFVNGATSRLNRTGSPDIPATSCTYESATRLICTYNLLGQGASPPNYHVVVTNPDGKSGLRANYVTLNSPAPTITSSTPATGLQAATVSITNLRGTNFQPGATVLYYQGTTSLPVTSVNVVSPTQITGTLVIPSDAPTGVYNVTVTNSDGKTITRAATFTVTSNAPTLATRVPSSGNRGWPLSLTLTGTLFQPGSTVRITLAGQPDLVISGVNAVNSTYIFCTVHLLGAYVPGGTSGTGISTWNVTVTNPDGKSATRGAWFTVSSATPTIASSPAFSPNTGARGTKVTTSFNGTYFQPGATVQFALSPTTMTAYNVVVVSPSRITCTIDIPAGASTGSYSATITNTDGRTATRTARFTVT
jgi:hypothetical protein